MSICIDVALECDGLPMYGCNVKVYDRTAKECREVARRRGWQTKAPGGKDYCPTHRKTKPRGAA